MNIKLEITVDDARWTDALPNVVEAAEKVKAQVFADVRNFEHIEILKTEKPIIINLCLSTDDVVQKLNRDFRNKDMPTNVLSFANVDFDNFENEIQIYESVELGDIIIAYETTQKEAETEGITLYAHFCHLLVHGILHLLGYDHIEDDEAEHMEKLEVEILKRLDIANPYKD